VRRGPPRGDRLLNAVVMPEALDLLPPLLQEVTGEPLPPPPPAMAFDPVKDPVKDSILWKDIASPSTSVNCLSPPLLCFLPSSVSHPSLPF